MERFLAIWAVLWLLSFFLPLLLSNERSRRVAAWLLPALGICALYFLRNEWGPWLRLAAASLGLLYLIKGTVLLQYPAARIRALSRWGLLIYMTIWPGMSPEPFESRGTAADDAGRRFVKGLLIAYAGLAFIIFLALSVLRLPPLLIGWAGIAALLLTVHFGLSDVLTGGLQAAGWRVGPLFDEPHKSGSLREFWSARWNIAFVEMDKRLFLRPLARRLGAQSAFVGVFIISGVLHEMGISYPAMAGFGLPLLYFLVQGAAISVEARLPVSSRLFTLAIIILPLPLLFHPPFHDQLIVPLFHSLHAALTSRPMEFYLDKALWIAAVLQLFVLIASFQVPTRLRWKDDLSKLSSFNRKLMWTYGLFIVLTILAFSVLTFALHDEFLRGNPAALGLAAFIAIFWTVRVAVDLFYFSKEDWPEGSQFVIGHLLLASLFVCLIAIYAGLLMWHGLR